MSCSALFILSTLLSNTLASTINRRGGITTTGCDGGNGCQGDAGVAPVYCSLTAIMSPSRTTPNIWKGDIQLNVFDAKNVLIGNTYFKDPTEPAPTFKAFSVTKVKSNDTLLIGSQNLQVVVTDFKAPVQSDGTGSATLTINVGKSQYNVKNKNMGCTPGQIANGAWFSQCSASFFCGDNS